MHTPKWENKIAISAEKWKLSTSNSTCQEWMLFPQLYWDMEMEKQNLHTLKTLTENE